VGRHHGDSLGLGKIRYVRHRKSTHFAQEASVSRKGGKSFLALGKYFDYPGISEDSKGMGAGGPGVCALFSFSFYTLSFFFALSMLWLTGVINFEFIIWGEIAFDNGVLQLHSNVQDYHRPNRSARGRRGKARQV